MSIDWDDLQKAAAPGADIPTLKRELAIAYVLTVNDIDVMDGADGRLVALCPFHDDAEPSFAVFGEGMDKWDCWSCEAGPGDVLDLIQMLPQYEASTVGDAVQIARQLLDDARNAGWEGPKPRPKRAFDIETAATILSEAQDPAGWDLLNEFLEAKGFTFDAEWLNENFRVGRYGTWAAVVPYINREGDLVGYKHRMDADTKFFSAAGSALSDMLYNEDKDDMVRPVLLVESETDAWRAFHELGDEFNVMALSHGASQKPGAFVDRFRGRDVVLAFDGDAAGRRATAAWHTALTQNGAVARIVSMPDDHDAASVVNLVELVGRARNIPEIPQLVRRDSQYQGYVRPSNKDTLEALSNFYFDADRELFGSDGTAYEGVVMPAGVRTVITSGDLSSKSKLIAWAARHGAAFFGSDRDAQQILGLLQHQGPFLKVGKMATVAGLHENHFIYPGGRIGPDYWVYVPPPADIHLDGMMQLVEGDWRPEQLAVMRRLHAPAVMDPILSWLAVAPLRSLLREFPILSVTGSAGTGKTTLLETILKAFTATSIMSNLTATTNHALFSFVGSTNAFPVYFDEFRREIRRDTADAFRQTLRDAYTGQGSAKGGMGSSWADVNSVKATAPIIVSGEDTFAETSHTERMVLVSLPLHGRNPKILEQIRGWGSTGFAHAYLAWLQRGLVAGTLPALEVEPAGPENLPNRQRINIGTLYLGWELLTQFLTEHDINAEVALGAEPDYSIVIAEGQESAASNPIRDALLWALGETDAHEFSVEDTKAGKIYIRVENLVIFIERHSTITLPGGVKAIRKFLQTHYHAVDTMATIEGKAKYCMGFDAEELRGNAD